MPIHVQTPQSPGTPETASSAPQQAPVPGLEQQTTNNSSAGFVEAQPQQPTTSNPAAQSTEIQKPPPGSENTQTPAVQAQDETPIPGLRHPEDVKAEQEQAVEKARIEAQVKAEQEAREANARAQQEAQAQAVQQAEAIKQQQIRAQQEEQARLQQQAQQQAEAAAAAQISKVEKDFAVGNAPLENTDGTPIVGLDASATASNLATAENAPNVTSNSSEVDIDVEFKDIDPTIREAIKSVSHVADFAAKLEKKKMIEQGHDTQWLEKKQEGIVDAYTTELTPIFRSVHGVRPQEQTQGKPTQDLKKAA